MELLRSPRNKLIASALLLALLSAAAIARGFDVVTAARCVLAAVALGGLALWAFRARAARAHFELAPRLVVVSRAGLAQRCGVALVEADGRTFLVVHGDGYAEVCDAPALAPRQGRRGPRRPRRASGQKGVRP